MEENNKIIEIREANDIVEVISSYLPLIKKGKNYFGVCPFHDDTNPSMSVSSEKQIYKCFSCGASGNVYNFVMDYEHVDFKEALSILANRCGISLNNNYIKNENNKYKKLYDAYSLALKLYQNNLNGSNGLVAKTYLETRGITKEAIKKFKIGLSTKDQDNLTKILISKDYTIKELNDIGLSYNDKDLYINRIMFPLFDISGNVVGFSGRIYDHKSDSKYVNTKETKIFKKGEILYNYYNAKDEIRKSKSLIIVEGFMDVIRLYISGIYNVVALMGTSLTKEQIALLKRLSNNIILSLDGDEPGQKAISNIGEMLINENFNVKVIALKDNMDPDEFILNKGKEAYNELLNNAINYSDYKINFLKKGKDFTSIEDETSYINSVLDEISKEKDLIKQELLINKISKDFNIDSNILKKKLQNVSKYSKIKTFTKREIQNEKIDKYHQATYAILYYMLTNEEALNLYEKKLNYLPYKEERFLANEIIYYNNNISKINIADFFTFLNDKEELLNVLKKVMSINLKPLDNVDDLCEYFDVITNYDKSLEIKRLKKQMEEEISVEEKVKLAEKIRLMKIGS